MPNVMGTPDTIAEELWILGIILSLSVIVVLRRILKELLQAEPESTRGR